MSKIIAFPGSHHHGDRHEQHDRADLRPRYRDDAGSDHGRSSLHRLAPRQRTLPQAGGAAPFRKLGSNKPLVSVVVPTCNRPQLLERCLAALAAQAFDPTQYEILVADDAPGGDTRATVEEWAQRTAIAGPSIFYMPSGQDTPQGPATARNRGWRAAQGAVIAFTDDDTIPQSDWLNKGMAAFDGKVQAAWGRIVMPLQGLPTDYERDAKGLEQAEFVTANCFCLKQVLEELDGFDERFRLAWREDADLYFRLLQSDAVIAYVPEAVVEHPIRPAPWGVSLKQQKKVQFDALLFKKHRALYRQKIRAAARWDYYVIVACLLVMLTALALRRFELGTAAGLVWAALTARFCGHRLRGTAITPTHVAEMIVTSILIPPLAVFWRLVGAIRFRVGFA